MRRLERSILTALLLTAAAPAVAYQREDHYYSLRMALGSSAPRLAGDDVVAMCGQLADESLELNPIQVYRRMMRHPLAYAAWSLRDRGADDTVGRMVTVQQLLHGLTGGSSAAAHEIAVDTARGALEGVRKASDPAGRNDALCALGFALHFYGDSFAHRRIYNPRKMYPTGLGHMFDGSTPDLPLYTPARLALWYEYIKSLKTLFPEFSHEKLEPFFQRCEECRKQARDTNAYASADLRRSAALHLAQLGIAVSLLERSPVPLTCQQLVDAHAAKSALSGTPDCERAWTRYRAEAERAFAAYDADPAHANAPSRGVRRRYYEGPMFDGAKP